MPPAVSWFFRRPVDRAWVVVLATYVLVYGGLLWATDGYPYVLDNNESYSSWWHARSLFENGVAQTKGLTDEVFSTSPAASPNIHSHQGNLPRLFTFLLYAAGCRSIGLHIWITTFTVGLAGIYFAFRFLAGLANRRFAALACLVMITNYLLFAQWQVSLYNVWHVFFFFSSLLCVRALGCPEHRRRWAGLALLNFAAFFYWEYVFTAFVVALSGLYALVLYWRRPRTVLRVGLIAGAGAALAAGLLLAQLTAYMGWSNVMEDVRLTLTARNVAADPALLERVTSFYREHRIIFWHNFLDAAPLRTLAAFWESLRAHHLSYYTSPLVLAMFLIGVGWLAGLWQPRSGLLARPRAGNNPGPAAFAKWLGLAAVLGWLAPGIFPPESTPSPRSPLLWLGAAGFSLLLGRAWLGGWWAWARLGWRRFIPLGLFTLAAGWLTRPQSDLTDPAFQHALAEAAGWTGWGLPSQLILPGAMLLALSLAGLGSGQVLGTSPAARLTRLPLFLFCSLLAYAVTYRLFTGYIYSGYLHRTVPMLVFVTDLLLALAIYAALQPLDRFIRQRPPLARTWPLAIPLLLSALLPLQWYRLQQAYALVVPPDRYAFLAQLDQAPFKGRSLVTNTYPAPMAARTGAWGYADTSIFSGRVTLTPQGFETERDLKYLWFADRATNAAYLKPDLAITVVQTPNLEVAMQLKREQARLPAGALPLAEASGLAQRAHPLQQAFLHHRLRYSDGNHVSIVSLDWDYPPFLRSDFPRFLPAVGDYTLAQKMALDLSAEALHRRWRLTLTPADPSSPGSIAGAATIDGRPVFPPITLAAAGWREMSGKSAWQNGTAGARPLSAVFMGDLVELTFQTGPGAGKVRVEINDFIEELDLQAATSSSQSHAFSSALPHGRHTFIPSFAPGMCVQTTVKFEGPRPFAEIYYHYAHQEDAPEAGTKVRVYRELPAGHWSLADTITFLGAKGVPVRMEAFREANPDTVAEHARIAASGDPRSYQQWLADFLDLHPGERWRPGIVTESLPVTADAGNSIVRRRIPLPANRTEKLQITVSPGTRTKSGPEYFGLPFSPVDTPPRVSAPIVIDYPPPVIAPGTPLPFGRLKLRVRFPANHHPQSEPLVSSGIYQGGDFLYAIYVDEKHIRFGFDHWFKGGPLSPPIPVDYSREHELEISMGSLFPPRESIVFATMNAAQVAEAKNRVIVKLDGQVVLDAAGECYESRRDNVLLGRNAIQGTSCGPVFNGEIISVERVWPWPEQSERAP